MRSSTASRLSACAANVTPNTQLKFQASCAVDPGKLMSRTLGSGVCLSALTGFTPLLERPALVFSVIVRASCSSSRPSTIRSSIASMRDMTQLLRRVSEWKRKYFRDSTCHGWFASNCAFSGLSRQTARLISQSRVHA